MALGKPAISTPARLELRPVQAAIEGARQRIEALEALVTTLSNTSLSASAIAALQAQVNAITLADGTVTSVKMTVPSFMGVTGSPVTTVGTLAVSFNNQPRGVVLAGPVSGVDAAPDFRALQWDYDLPLISSLPFTSGLDGHEIVLIERYGEMFWTTVDDILARVSATARVTLAIACSDETTPVTTGTNKVRFINPYSTAFIVEAVVASLNIAQASGSIFTVDINEEGTSILSTKLTIDNGEKTSGTAAAPPVISDNSIAPYAEIEVDVDQVGDGTAAGLKVYLIGHAS